MRTERFDPAGDTVAVRACHEIYLAAARADGMRRPAMSPRTFRAWLRYGWTEDPSEVWLARHDDGEVSGWYLLTLPKRENRHLADVHLVVAPSHRRAGLGTALADHAADRAREAGRTILTGRSDEFSAGTAFARSLGAQQRLVGTFSVLRLGAIPPGHLTDLRRKAAAAAAGYSLVSWEGPTSEHRLTDVAALLGIEADAPRAAGRSRRAGTRPGSGRPTSGWPIRGGDFTVSPPGRNGPGHWWRSPSSVSTRSTRAGVSSR